MKKLEIGPTSGKTPDGCPVKSWDTLDSAYAATYKVQWGSKKLPITASTYDWVHASHVLEHVPWWKTDQALIEVCRILKPGGRFTVWVPNGIGILKMYLEQPDKLLKLEEGWGCGGKNPSKDIWKYLNARIFWGARQGELGQEQHFHRAIFDFGSLSKLLNAAGFTHIREIQRDKPVDAGHGWMEIGAEAIK